MGRLVTPQTLLIMLIFFQPFKFRRVCVDLARLLRRAYSRSVWIIFFEFVKVCGIRFSISSVARTVDKFFFEQIARAV